MRVVERAFLLFVFAFLLASCSTTMKVVCINVEEGSMRTVALRHLKDSPASPDTYWSGERLLNVDEETGVFFSITCDNSRKHCYINVYSPDGVFVRQYQCPYFEAWHMPFVTVMVDGELLSCGEFLGGKLGLLLSIIKEHFPRMQLVSYNVKTEQKEVVFSNISDRMEIYHLIKCNSKMAIIEILQPGDAEASWKGIEVSDDFRLVVYNAENHELVEIKLPANWQPLLLKGKCKEGKLWYTAIEKDAEQNYVAEHLLEVGLDGKVTEITDLPVRLLPGGQDWLNAILVHKDNPDEDEYIYLCEEEQKASADWLKRNRTYLCRYFPASATEDKIQLKLKRGGDGISAIEWYVSDDRIGLELYKLNPSNYWEAFFTLPPKANSRSSTGSSIS